MTEQPKGQVVAIREEQMDVCVSDVTLSLAADGILEEELTPGMIRAMAQELVTRRDRERNRLVNMHGSTLCMRTLGRILILLEEHGEVVVMNGQKTEPGSQTILIGAAIQKAIGIFDYPAVPEIPAPPPTS